MLISELTSHVSNDFPTGVITPEGEEGFSGQTHQNLKGEQPRFLLLIVRCLLLVTVGSFTMPFFPGVLVFGWPAVLMLMLFGFSLELLLHLTEVGR